MWTGWMLTSAVFLALYDISKKASVRGNSVLPVLLVSSASGTAVYAAVLAAAGAIPSLRSVSAVDFLLIATKSVIVGTSWILTYCALRTLPVTIATPIRASAPALVFLGAFFLYGERPTPVQGVGMLLVFVGYWMFGWAGRHEGIDFLRSRAVWYAVGGMVMSAVSSLWDKFLFQKRAVPVETVQFWFQLVLVGIYALLLAAGALRRRGESSSFEWRWTIPLTGVLLVVADWFYFRGLSIPDVSIAAGSLLRRFSVAITFVLGALFFGERNLRRKSIALAATLVGIVLMCI